MRIWVVGFGTAGRWFLRALRERPDALGAGAAVVGLADSKGFVHDERGIDVEAALAAGSLAELPGERFATALEGLRATEADLLVEVAGSAPADGSGAARIREALGRGIPVATSNKWPVALHGVELAELARANGTRLRAESTVMSGTPVLGPLTEGLAGAEPAAIRGVLNATANFILTRMRAGAEYDDALAEAQAAGLAERDPTADVEGHDSVAKLMVLAALVFGRQLAIEDVERRGIAGTTRADAEAAARDGGALRELATLQLRDDGSLAARVEPAPLPAADPLARVDGTQNMLVCRAAPLGEVAFTGPGAGPELAGYGVLSDAIALART